MSPPSSNEDPLIKAVSALDIPIESRLLVAVSGGPDSVALLDSLHRITVSGRRAWTLRVGHVNHGLRGQESDGDEAFVRALAAQWGLSLDVQHVQTMAFAASHKLSTEAAARELRYRALEDMLTRWPGDFILTGHTQDDQAETLVLRLLRGTGVTGLAGIRARRGNIIRPFLDISRETVIQALQQRDLRYRVDSSNLDVRHARNRVRREVMPLLGRIQPRARETMARTAALLGNDAEYILQEAARAAALAVQDRTLDCVRLSSATILSLHPALRSHVVRHLLHEVAQGTVALVEGHMRFLSQRIERQELGVVASLPDELTAEIIPGSVVLRRGRIRQPSAPFDFPLPMPGTLQLPDGELRVAAHPMANPAELHRHIVVCGPWHALCDADRLGTDLHVRSRRPGDRIVPLGMSGSRKVQDVLVDARVPQVTRDGIPLIASEKHVVWIPGIMLDNRVAVGDTTAHVVHLVYRRRS
jgi:tRNA(Ile)-lysidine synthase